MLTTLPPEQRYFISLEWVQSSARFFISTFKGATEQDQDKAQVIALRHFLAGSSGADAIYQGFARARADILARQARISSKIKH